MQVDPRVLIAYLTQVIVWGTTWAAIKIGVTDVPPWIFALDRSVLVAASLGAVALALRLPLPRDPRTLAIAAVAGAVNSGVSWAIIFWAERFVPSGLVAVFGATAPIWTAFLAHFLIRGDRLSALKVAALALGFAGIVALAGTSGQIEGERGILAAVLLVLMPAMWAASGIVIARELGGVSPIPAISLGSAAGGVFLIPFALSEMGEPARWSTASVAALIYLSLVGSGVGLVVNMWLYRRLRPTTIMLAQLLITAEAVLIGALALGETVTPGMLLGAVLVLTAIALNARGGRPAVPPRPSLPEQAAVTPAD